MKGQTLSRHFNGKVLCDRGMHCVCYHSNETRIKLQSRAQKSAVSKWSMIFSLYSRQIRPSTDVPHALSQNEVTSFWAELVTKTMNTGLTFNVYKTSDSLLWYHSCDSRLSPWRSITASRPSFKWKSTYAPAQKVRLRYHLAVHCLIRAM